MFLTTIRRHIAYRRFYFTSSIRRYPRHRVDSTNNENPPLNPRYKEIHYSVSFGSIRKDSVNKLRYHGQLDDDLDDKREDYTIPDTIHTTTSPTTNYVESSKDDDESSNFWFEDIENEIRPEIQLESMDTENFIDDQYFGQEKEEEMSNINYDYMLPIDCTDSYEEMKKLRNESTRDLNYIDRQIFPTTMTEDDDKETVKRRNKQRKRSNSTIAKPGSALEFVQNESKKKPTSSIIKVTSKETLLDEIGVSLQKRITDVYTSIEDTPVSSKTVPRSSSSLSSSSSISDSNPTERLKSQYKPQIFREMTSMELAEILKNCVIYNDNEILALNKPYGIPMSSNKPGHSLQKYLTTLQDHFEISQLYQVHRLDKTTTGVVLYAQSRSMHSHLIDLFRRRRITKRYWAITNGIPQPEAGLIDIPLSESLVRDDVSRYRMTLRPEYKASPDLRFKKTYRGTTLEAKTQFNTLFAVGNAALVEIIPETGVKHQIRAHLGFGLSTPILGDHKYSHIREIGKPQNVKGDILQRLKVRKSKSRDLPIFLHARQVSIPEIADNGEDLRISAKLPHFFNKVKSQLRLE